MPVQLIFASLVGVGQLDVVRFSSHAVGWRRFSAPPDERLDGLSTFEILRCSMRLGAA